ncbi:MAG: DUF308 domain-containing protein [Ruminiclostridium sp.]|nr:DUF308 domain-containing protein [Ruminiclostridium sp.]
MKKERINALWLFVYGCAMIFLGVFVLIKGEVLMVPFAVFGGVFVIVNGVHRFIKGIMRESRTRLLSWSANTVIGLFLLFAPLTSLALITVVFSLYLILNAVIKLIDLIHSIKNGTEDFSADFIALLFFLVFAILMLVGASQPSGWLSAVIGVYCILYGVTELKDFMREILPRRAKNILRRSIRFSLPLAISTFSPLAVLKTYSKRLNSREIDVEALLKEEKAFDDDKRANIHVLIHVSLDGVGMVGHCDIVYKNKVISYGNYDASSERLFGAVGDGVMFIAEPDKYISYSIENDKQMVIDFGLLLSDKQIRRVRREMARIKKTTYRWRCPFEKAVYEGRKAELSDFSDYCSKLWHGTKARFYKFSSGKWKSYFVMSTNCVLLADSILSKAGTDIINTAGIISPGAYYDYLQKEYTLKNGIVVSRDVYGKFS